MLKKKNPFPQKGFYSEEENGEEFRKRRNLKLGLKNG